MADSIVKRIIRIVFDRASADQANAQLNDSLASAGKTGGAAFLKELRDQFTKSMADLRVQLAKGLIDPKQFKQQADAAAAAFNTGLLAAMDKAKAAGTLTNAEYLKLAKTLKQINTDSQAASSGPSAFGIGAAVEGFRLVAQLIENAIRSVLGFGTNAVKAASDSDKAWHGLAGTVAAAGGNFAKMEANVRLAATTFQSTTVHSQTDYANSLQRLIALSGDVGASLNNMGIVANVAARFFGGDLVAATDAVAKAMDLGYATINRTKFTLDELAQRSMGAAAEETQTFSGKLAQLNNGWLNFKIRLGDALISSNGTKGALDLLVTGVKNLTTWVANNGDEIRRWVTTAVNTAITAMSTLLDLIKTYGQLKGTVSLTAGAAPTPLANNATDLQKQIDNFKAQRAVVAKQQADALAQLTAAEAAGPGLLRTLVGGPEVALAKSHIEGLRLNLQSLNDELQQIDDNAGKATTKLAGLDKKTGKPPGYTDPLSITTPQAGKNLQEDPAAKAERQRYEETKDAIEGERQELALVTAAYGKNAQAVSDANRDLATEREMQSATKGMTDAHTKAIRDLIAARDAERTSVEALKRSEDIKQEISDTERLEIAHQQGLVAAHETEVQLSREAEIRRLTTGLTADQAAAITKLARQLFGERDALIAIQNAYDQNKRLTDLSRETEQMLRRNEAAKQGADASRALDRELFIENTVWTAQNEAMAKGIKLTDDYIARLKKLAGQNYDAAHTVKNVWANAIQTLDTEIEGLAQAWTEGSFAGIVAYAKQEARLLIGKGIAEGAEALASLAFGDARGAAQHEAAAVEYGVAAAAMAAIGGGVGGPTGGAGTGSSSSGSAAAGSSTQPPGADVTIVLSGPGFNALNPKVQEVVYGAQQMARQRWGDNAHIRVVGRSGG